MPRASALIVLALLLTGASPARLAHAQPEWVPSEPLVEGKRVFDEKGCSRCHNVSGKAQEAIGPDLARERSWQDVIQLGGSLWNHAPAMAERMRRLGVERPTLSAEEVGKVAAYLFYLQFLDEPGSVERGRTLFEERSCAKCHQLAGHGGTVGPRLDELAPYTTAIFMAQALWNHGPQMAARTAELGIGRPRLEDDDLAHIVAFIRGGTPVSVEQISAQAGRPHAGKALFTAKGCVRCHAIRGTGGAVGPDLGSRRARRRVAEMAGALWNHGPPMWAKMQELGLPFPRITESEMSDLLAYLYFVQYVGESGDPAKGAEIFRGKGCARCHAVGDVGKPIGPSLTASPAIGSPTQWASALWNHAPAMATRAQQENIPWPRFGDDEMRDLVAFLRAPHGEK